ncbi:hypothetical protein A2U01_0034656, partial [Trifolium medium]|nr:hypothetical protein [Trifolium medium]
IVMHRELLAEDLFTPKNRSSSMCLARACNTGLWARAIASL